MKIIIGIIVAIIILSLFGKGKDKKNEKPEKSYFFEGGDDFTDEDYAFLEIMEEDEEI